MGIKTYQDTLYLHPSKADFSGLTATVRADGILMVRIPKKETKNRAVSTTIRVSSDSPPPPAPDSSEAANEVRGFWDLPGVSATDLVVEIRSGNRDDNKDQLRVTIGQRMHRKAKSDDDDADGNDEDDCTRVPVTMLFPMMRRSTTIPGGLSSIDTTQAHAYLHRGVFTLVVPPAASPLKEEVNDEDEDNRKCAAATTDDDDVGVRTFYATPEEEEKEDGMDIDDEKDDKEQEDPFEDKKPSAK